MNRSPSAGRGFHLAVRPSLPRVERAGIRRPHTRRHPTGQRMLGRARLTPSSPRGLSLTKRSRALRASSLTRILPNPVSGGRSPGPASHTYPREAPRRVSPKEERHERGTHHSPEAIGVGPRRVCRRRRPSPLPLRGSQKPAQSTTGGTQPTKATRGRRSAPRMREQPRRLRASGRNHPSPHPPLVR
jgi:hypothetical protein